jgi:L-amino acid N-acyltransferase YncA
LDSACHLSLPSFENGLLVIPVSIPDDESMVDRIGITDELEIAKIWEKIFQSTYARGELFTIQLHPERIKFCQRGLENILRQARESQRKVWIASLGEISEWWKEKEGFTFETYTEGIGKWRVNANCSSKATILVRNCRVNQPTMHWTDKYQSVSARDFVVESDTRPFVGVSPNTSPDALNFLKGEGIIVEVSDQPQHYALYFDDLGEFGETDKKRVTEEIENSSTPLIRYWRWPEKAQSALAVTGDIDALTLIDFAMRIYEFWRQKIKQKLLLQNSTLRKLRYAILLIKVAGLMPFLRELRRQIYSKTTFLGLEKTLEPNTVHVQCRTKYSLRPASREDMEEILSEAKQEVGESARELLQRKWFYDCGFRDCYVARAAGSGDLCYIQWLVSSRDDSVVKRGFTKRLPRLKRDEILVENTFTFPKYRGNGVYPSAMVELADIARSRGFRRMLVYVREDNIASLKGCQRAGFKEFERIPEVKLLFLTWRKHK